MLSLGIECLTFFGGEGVVFCPVVEFLVCLELGLADFLVTGRQCEVRGTYGDVPTQGIHPAKMI